MLCYKSLFFLKMIQVGSYNLVLVLSEYPRSSDHLGVSQQEWQHGPKF